ncbi:MAG: FG-GAP repeat domain-containing protein, partial [Planctomycetaceae bacterium]
MTNDRTPDTDDYQETTNDEVIGLALKWSVLAVIVFGSIAAGAAWYFTRPEEVVEVLPNAPVPTGTREQQDIVLPDIPFKDITQEAGITFVQENGAGLMRQMKDGTTQASKFLPETMCGGGGFFDFDNDGDQDILFVNAKRWDWDTENATKSTCALYANDGSGNFTDVTAGSGLDISLYGMGVAFGDYDGDGLVDVFLSAVGSNRLLKNKGDGKFEDVTESTGVAGDGDRWSSSCGFCD